MIDLEVVTEFMFTHFEQVKVSNNGTHFLARCPLCGDSKKSKFKRRFNLDYNNGVPGWHCFNCPPSDSHGNFYEIYSRMKGISYEDAVERLNKGKYKWDKEKVEKKLNGKKPKVNQEKFTKYNWILDDCYGVHWFTAEGILGKQYLSALAKFVDDRKIPEKYPLYVAYRGKYKNRIIIPVSDKDDDIVYFQARRIPGTKLEPKYKNPATPKEIIILNSHLFDPDKYIVVTEGIIDAYMVGDQGTTCLGKEISEDFLKKLFAMTRVGVIIALDNDKEGVKALKKFMDSNKFSTEVRYFFHPLEFMNYDDINSIVRNTNIDDVYSLIVNNSCTHYAANIRLKL